MSAVILDTETTGVGDDDKVIEFACSAPLENPYDLLREGDISIALMRFSSERPISYGAMATHHIIEEDLVGKPVFSGFDPPPGVEYIIAHNVDFDWRMMGKPNIKRICTLALARSLWPLIDSHSLGAMVYHLTEDRSDAREMVKGAHSADADVAMLLEVLLPAILRKNPGVASWSDLWQISEKARIPTVMTFGKHKGMAIGDVPADYKRWLLNQPDVDPYLAIALRGR